MHPFLISIPHGGTKTPEELSGRVCISRKDLFEDGDAFSREIYGVEGEVLALVATDIARAFIDQNRETTDRPPKNPDGIVKTRTCHNQPIYSRFPERPLIETLIRKYYAPYHATLRQTLDREAGLRLALDCHTMESVGPEISPDQGRDRPVFCLGNNWGKSCPDTWVKQLAASFRESFQLQDEDIRINDPFAGGYITRKYGNAPVPWVQIEMNRKLYLSGPDFDRERLTVHPRRLRELRTAFSNTLKRFAQKLELMK